MINIAVCEDEPVLLNQLTGQVKTIFEKHSIAYHIESYTNAGALLSREAFDLQKLEALLLSLSSSLLKKHRQAIAVRQGTHIQRVPLDKILYLEVLDRKIYLHTSRETIPFYGKLEELEPSLPKMFFRCHRSYIVNMQHIKRYDKGEITLYGSETIPLSKRRYPSFGPAFMQYIKESGDIF